MESRLQCVFVEHGPHGSSKFHRSIAGEFYQRSRLPGRLFRNIAGLVNVNKKRWKDPPCSMGTSTISMASYSSSQTVTVITRGYYTCRVGEIQSKYDQEQQNPNIPIRSPTKGCDSQQLEWIIPCLLVIHPIELYIRQYPPLPPSDRSARWCPSLLGDVRRLGHN